MIMTLLKLSFAGIRSRLLASFLTIMVSGAAAATIVLILELGATGVTPWQRTFEAAHGAHILASTSSEADARAIASLPGVAERDQPVPRAIATMVLNEGEFRVFLAGLDGRPLINAPVLTEGSEVREGGIVLERSLARALGVQVDSMLTIPTSGGQINLVVLGTAVSPSQARYPRSNPGLAWVTRSTLEAIKPNRADWRWLEAVRLADPASAPAFAEQAAAAFASNPADFAAWQEQRDLALQDVWPAKIIVSAYSLLLLIVAFTVVAILAGARANHQHREIALLKAIGLTPRQVSAIFVIESAALGLVAVACGFGVGAIVAPELAAPSADTLIGAPTMAASPWHFLIAGGIVLPILVISGYISTRRSTSMSVLRAIQAGIVAPAARSRLAQLVGRSALPLPIAVGLKDLLARRARAIWMMGAMTVTGAAIVTTLSVQAALNARPAGEPSDVPDELPVLIYTLDSVLLLITATTLLAVAFLSVRERVRDFGVLKAIGFTPREISAGLVGAHAALAVVASLFAIPIGIALYLALYSIAADDTADPAAVAPWWWLASIALVLPLLAALATSIPAQLATRIPTADAVRYE